jgi:hypothetical protein
MTDFVVDKLMITLLILLNSNVLIYIFTCHGVYVQLGHRILTSHGVYVQLGHRILTSHGVYVQLGHRILTSHVVCVQNIPILWIYLVLEKAVFEMFMAKLLGCGR